VVKHHVQRQAGLQRIQLQLVINIVRLALWATQAIVAMLKSLKMEMERGRFKSFHTRVVALRPQFRACEK
jgi:hypothetical protein